MASRGLRAASFVAAGEALLRAEDDARARGRGDTRAEPHEWRHEPVEPVRRERHDTRRVPRPGLRLVSLRAGAVAAKHRRPAARQTGVQPVRRTGRPASGGRPAASGRGGRGGGDGGRGDGGRALHGRATNVWRTRRAFVAARAFDPGPRRRAGHSADAFVRGSQCRSPTRCGSRRGGHSGRRAPRLDERRSGSVPGDVRGARQASDVVSLPGRALEIRVARATARAENRGESPRVEQTWAWRWRLGRRRIGGSVRVFRLGRRKRRVLAVVRVVPRRGARADSVRPAPAVALRARAGRRDANRTFAARCARRLRTVRARAAHAHQTRRFRAEAPAGRAGAGDERLRRGRRRRARSRRRRRVAAGDALARGVHRVVLRRLAVLPDARPGARVARAVARRAGHGGAPQRRGRAVRGAVRGGRLRRGGKRARRGDGRVRCSRRRRRTEHVPRPRRGGARLDRAGGLRVGSDVFRRRRARRRRARDTEALRPRRGRRAPRVRAAEKEGRRSRIVPAPSRVRARERANRRRSQSHARAVA